MGRYDVPAYYVRGSLSIPRDLRHEPYALYNRERLIQCYQILGGIPGELVTKGSRLARLDPTADIGDSRRIIRVNAFDIFRASALVWIALHPWFNRKVKTTFKLVYSGAFDPKGALLNAEYSLFSSDASAAKTGRVVDRLGAWDRLLVHPGGPRMPEHYAWTRDLFSAPGVGVYDDWLRKQNINLEDVKATVLARLIYAISYYSN